MTSFRAALGDEQVPGLADPVQVGGLRVRPAGARPERTRRFEDLPRGQIDPGLEDAEVLEAAEADIEAGEGDEASAVVVPRQIGVDPGQVERHAVAPRPYRVLRGEHDVSPTGDCRHDDVEHPVVNTDGRCVDTSARRSRLDAELLRASGDVTDQLPVLEISALVQRQAR